MVNPFEEIIDRLERMEKLLSELKEMALTTKNGVSADNDKIVDTKELCHELKITQPTVIRYRKKGRIPFFYIGSSVRFNLHDVIKSLEKNR
jgi:excisionase family DNA binding protein